MKEVVKDISLLNELVLNPDKFIWGAMTEEEADDHYNNVDSSLYDDWGDKSMNMIMWIKDLESIKEEDCGFGTQYHDGTGFADCDEDNTGWRKCKYEPDRNKWCSECVYLYLVGNLN